jgi:hypothetical protein
MFSLGELPKLATVLWPFRFSTIHLILHGGHQVQSWWLRTGPEWGTKDCELQMGGDACQCYRADRLEDSIRPVLDASAQV